MSASPCPPPKPINMPVSTEEFIEACSELGEEEAVTSVYTLEQLLALPDADLAQAAVIARAAILALREVVDDHDTYSQIDRTVTRLHAADKHPGLRELL